MGFVYSTCDKGERRIWAFGGENCNNIFKLAVEASIQNEIFIVHSSQLSYSRMYACK